MPFYEYQCNNCGHTLEAMQKVSDAPLKKCPHCGKSQLQRLMSAPVFRLKGGGWYETDFKSDQDNKRNLADRPEAQAPKEEKKETAEAAVEGAPRRPMRPSRRKSPPTSRPRRPRRRVCQEAGRRRLAAAAPAPNKSNVRKAVKRPAGRRRSAPRRSRRGGASHARAPGCRPVAGLATRRR